MPPNLDFIGLTAFQFSNLFIFPTKNKKVICISGTKICKLEIVLICRYPTPP